MAMFRARARGTANSALILLLAVLGCGFAALPAGAKIRSLSKLAVIGDSYSDAGNSGLLNQASGFPVFPSPYYADGRFTNGSAAVERLWARFNPSLPALRPSQMAGGTNYAVGGATSGLDSYFNVAIDMPDQLRPVYDNSSAKGQLTRLLSAFTPGSFDPSSTLFVYWMGPNDGLYWLTTNKTPGNVSTNTGPVQANAFEMLQNSKDNIETGLQLLINNGARHLLVPNLMDFGKAPAFSGDPSQAAAVTALSLGFNQKLDQVLVDLRLSNPGVDIMGFNTYGLFEKIFTAPDRYGFSNKVDACTSIYDPTTFAPGCSQVASDWLFWDGVHVTSAAHQVIADSMYQTVYEAPGPLPVAGGVVALGWGRRLRQRLRQRRRQPQRSRWRPGAA